MWWIAEKIAKEIVWRILRFLFRDHPRWSAVVASMSAAWSYLAGVSWEFWICVGIATVALGMSIQEKWFPDGFRRKFSRDARAKPKTDKIGTVSGSEPNVLPIKYGIGSSRETPDMGDLGEGIFLKNIGPVPAFDVVADSIPVGIYTLSFVGPEVTYLEPGDTCFFSTYSNDAPGSMFTTLRAWQSSIKDLGAEATGRIRFKDLDGNQHERRYRIGVDVLNRDSGGIVIRVVPRSSPDD